jgi:hypothetical protein
MIDGSYRNLLGGCRLDLIQDRDRCQTLMNAEVKLPVSRNVGNFFLTSYGNISFLRTAFHDFSQSC